MPRGKERANVEGCFQGGILSASNNLHLRLPKPERISLHFISFHELLFCKSSSSLVCVALGVHSVPWPEIAELCCMCEEHFFNLF